MWFTLISVSLTTPPHTHTHTYTVSDSSEESSYSLDEIRVTKPKVQARRSILDNLDETINSEAPPLKRTKRTQEVWSHVGVVRGV